jgi:hypothetical protein
MGTDDDASYVCSDCMAGACVPSMFLPRTRPPRSQVSVPVCMQGPRPVGSLEEERTSRHGSVSAPVKSRDIFNFFSLDGGYDVGREDGQTRGRAERKRECGHARHPRQRVFSTEFA